MAEVSNAAPAAPAPRRPDFGQVYRDEFWRTWHLLRRLGVREADLEDAVHDVFLVVHRRMGDFDPGRPIRPWMAGIAYRVASEARRKASARREELVDAVEVTGATPPQDEALDARRRRALVHAALGRLNPEQRAVFVLHELEGLTMPAIAEILEGPLNTMYSRLRLARADFTKQLGQLRPEIKELRS